VCCAVDRRTFAADAEFFALHADDDRDERFERTQILVELPAEAQRIAQPLQAKSRFRGQRGQMRLLGLPPVSSDERAACPL